MSQAELIGFDPRIAFERLGVEALLAVETAGATVVFHQSEVVPDNAYPEIVKVLPSWQSACEDDSAFVTREHLLRQDQIDGDSSRFMQEWLREAEEPFVVLTSTTSLRDPRAKQAFLQAHAGEVAAGLGIEPTEENIPQPVRTVTVSFGNVPVLVTAATSDSFIDNSVKAAIGSDFGLSSKKSKGASINAPKFDAKNYLGLTPGTVSPFIARGLAQPIEGLYYIKGELSPTTPVEIALSPVESLIIKRGAFERMLPAFMQRTPERKFKVL